MIIVRYYTDTNAEIISSVNLAGMVVAFISMVHDTKKCAKKKYRCYFLFTEIVGVILAIIIITLIITKIILIDSKGNDIITLTALIFSLPSNLYCRIVTKTIGKKCNNVH